MMRRATLLLVAILFITMLDISPAQATHRGMNCRTHNGPDGMGGVEVDVCVQINEDIFESLIQGHTDWHGSTQSLCGSIPAGGITVTQIEITREPDPGGLELRRGYPSDPNPPNDIMRSISTGWVDMCNVEVKGTRWLDYCPPAGAWDYRATMRYRLRWKQFSGDPVSSWYGLNSLRITFPGDVC